MSGIETITVRGQRDVLVDLLREAIGPLEISAACIEDLDNEDMADLISRAKNALDDMDIIRRKEVAS